MKAVCQHCRATVGSLYAFVRVVDYCRLQVVKCVICGWEVSRPEPPEALVKSVTKPMPKDARLPPLPKPKPSRRPFPRKPCTRVGCEGTFAATSRVQFQLCPNCSELVQRWKKRGMRTPPPLIRVDGRWYSPKEFYQQQGVNP